MVDKNREKSQTCGCAFLVDGDGRPIVECATPEEQDLVYRALRQYPDVNIRVAAAIATPVVVEDADDDLDDLADDESGVGTEDGELEFDDDDVELEEVEEDDALPF